MNGMSGYRGTEARAPRWVSCAGEANGFIWSPAVSLGDKAPGVRFLILGPIDSTLPRSPLVQQTVAEPLIASAGAHMSWRGCDYMWGRAVSDFPNVQTTNCAARVVFGGGSGYLQAEDALSVGLCDDPVPSWARLAVSLVQEGVSVGAGDLCKERISRLIDAFDDVPTSYNQMLVQGALDYCKRGISRLDEHNEAHLALLRKIQEFVSLVEGLQRQQLVGTPSTFSLIDLQLVEDKFELIQKKAAELNVLQVLGDIPTAELLNS